MIIRIIAIAAAALTISTCVAMAEAGGYVDHDPLALPRINPAGSTGTTMHHELPMRAIVNGHHVQPRRDLLDALGYSDLHRRRPRSSIVLIGSSCRKTSLQTECTLEMTWMPGSLRSRRPQGRGGNGHTALQLSAASFLHESTGISTELSGVRNLAYR